MSDTTLEPPSDHDGGGGATGSRLPPAPSSKYGGALSARRRGFMVFPLKPNNHEPLAPDRYLLATSDRSIISEWWAQDPDSNIGGVIDDKLVIIVEPDDGLPRFRNLKLAEDFPSTAWLVAPNRNALGFYSLPQGVRIRDGELAPGIRVVSGGYITMPGSTVVGVPGRWLNNTRCAPAPQWLIDRFFLEIEMTPEEAAKLSPAWQAMEEHRAGRIGSPAGAPSQSAEPSRPLPVSPSAPIAPVVGEDEDTIDDGEDEAIPQIQPAPKHPEPLVGDTDVATAFLRGFDPGGRHDHVAIDPYLPKDHPEKIECATFLPNKRDHDRMRVWIDQRQGVKDLYTSVNRARDDAPHNVRLNRTHIGTIRAVVGDKDTAKIKGGDPSGENFRSQRALLLGTVAPALAKEKCPPTMVVDTGGGLQPWWQLRPMVPATPENVELAQGIGRAIQAYLSGDGVWDAARIMRIPGTINVLSPAKREQGRSPAPATVLFKHSRNKAYSLEELAKAWPPIAQKGSAASGNKKMPEIDMEAVEADDYGALPAELRQRFEAYCLERPVVAGLWRGEEAPGQTDPSGSGFEFQLVGWLKRPGEFTPTEVAQLIAVYPFRSEKDADDLDRRVKRSWANNPAAYGGEGFEAVEIAPRKSATNLTSPQKVDGKFELDSVFPPLDPFDPAALPPIPWVIRKFLSRGTIVQLAGPGGISKSSLNMLFAVAATTGRQDLCPYQLPAKPKRVLVVNAEDSLDDMKRLLGALMQTYSLSHADLGGRLRLLSLLDVAMARRAPVPLVVRDGKGGFTASKDLENLIRAAHEFGADIVMLDPLVALHPAQESSNEEMRAVMQTLIRLPSEANCSCLLAHHFRKADKAADRSGGDASDARGASAIADACRGTLTLVEMSETDAEKLRLPEGTTRHDYVRLDDARISRAKRRTTPVWFRRESCEVGGDPDKDMPVLRPAQLEADVRPSLPHLLAKRIVAMGWTGERIRGQAVVEAMPEADQLWFGKNSAAWAREIKKGFDGASEAMTDFGILSWSAPRERVPLTLMLQSATRVAEAVAEEENGAVSET